MPARTYAERPVSLTDLQSIFEAAPLVWSSLRGRRLFITGGTGFFGAWMLETLAYLYVAHGIDVRATVLTRDSERIRHRWPHICAAGNISFISGDVRTFAFPDQTFDDVIHAATPVVDKLPPAELWDTIVGGTRRVLDLAVHSGAERFLLTSSGAVYGTPLPAARLMTEAQCVAPDPLSVGSGYGEGKRAAEWLCSCYSTSSKLECKVARCFAFVGPHLALDGHFAIGNFIRNAMDGRPIIVSGDGTPMRSYLYATDLIVWLFSILVNGRSAYAYNVGSEEAMSIRELALRVSAVFGNVPVEVAKEPELGRAPQWYVPSVARCRDELGLRQTVVLEEAVARTAAWNRR